MKLTVICCLFTTILLLATGCSSAAPVSADQISGTWSGRWGPSPSRQTEVTVALQWDGKTLQGTVNPGANAVKLAKSAFDSQTGSVKMELDGPNSRGDIVRYVIEGKLSGTTISGTFDRAGEIGTFRLEKQ